MDSQSPPDRQIRVRKSRIQRQRTSQVLAGELRNMILFGELDGRGNLPPESEFAEQLGVSRHHLREALRLLEQDGLVKVKPGRNGGIFLTVPTVEVLMRTFAGILARSETSLADVMAARLVLEPAAAALAAVNATEEELSALNALVESQEHELGDTGTVNSRFHVALTSAAHNRTLVLVMQAMEGLIQTLDLHAGTAGRQADSTDAQLQSGSLRAHQRILEAVRERDGEKAADLVRRHLLGFEEALRARGVDVERQTVAHLLQAAEANVPPGLREQL